MKIVPIESRSVAVFHVLRAHIRSAVGKVLRSARTTLREALRPTPIVTGFVYDIFRTRDELLAENAALRQQLVVASRAVKRPSFFPWERGLMVRFASVATMSATGGQVVVLPALGGLHHDYRRAA